VWNRVGELAAASGVGVALHYDCLGVVHSAEELSGLLAETDPALVGLALDTAELTIGGIDPVAFYEQHADRVTHVHLKDTLYADTGEEYLMPGAETTMLRGGAGRRIERWFFELGTDGGLVDVKAFVGALRERQFPGWVVVESDHGGNPAELAMLNSWYLQHELSVARS
jgi:inosose dehydratase